MTFDLIFGNFPSIIFQTFGDKKALQAFKTGNEIGEKKY